MEGEAESESKNGSVCVSAFILALLYAVNVLILKFKLACAMRTRVKECQSEKAIRKT